MQRSTKGNKKKFNKEGRYVKCRNNAGHMPARSRLIMTNQDLLFFTVIYILQQQKYRMVKHNQQTLIQLANKPIFSNATASVHGSNFQEAEPSACTEIL